MWGLKGAMQVYPKYRNKDLIDLHDMQVHVAMLAVGSRLLELFGEVCKGAKPGLTIAGVPNHIMYVNIYTYDIIIPRDCLLIKRLSSCFIK